MNRSLLIFLIFISFALVSCDENPLKESAKKPYTANLKPYVQFQLPESISDSNIIGYFKFTNTVSEFEDSTKPEYKLVYKYIYGFGKLNYYPSDTYIFMNSDTLKMRCLEPDVEDFDGYPDCSFEKWFEDYASIVQEFSKSSIVFKSITGSSHPFEIPIVPSAVPLFKITSHDVFTKVNKNNDIVLTWNKEVGTTENKVRIDMWLYGNRNTDRYVFFAEDTGSFTISKDSLSKYGKFDSISLELSVGRQKIVAAPAGKYYIAEVFTNHRIFSKLTE